MTLPASLVREVAALLERNPTPQDVDRRFVIVAVLRALAGNGNTP